MPIFIFNHKFHADILIIISPISDNSVFFAISDFKCKNETDSCSQQFLWRLYKYTGPRLPL